VLAARVSSKNAGRSMTHLGLVAIVVDDYDKAIAFFLDS
jgi:hypothetical protein